MSTLYARTMELLEESDESLLEVYLALRDKGITYSWLQKLKYIGVNDPGVNKIQILYEYLSGQKLTV